jgi:hypothetical protein
MTAHLLSARELEQHARSVLGGDVGSLSVDEIEIAMTQSTYVTDLCIAELERRGAIPTEQGMPVLPYRSHHAVEHFLTRAAEAE